MYEDNNRTPLPATPLECSYMDEQMATEETKRPNTLVNIRVISYRKRKHDPDGVSVKAVLDGIVRRGILADDSTDQINEVTFKSIISKEEKTVIEIESVDKEVIG